MTTMTETTYTTTGSIRGPCGHHHKTVKAARECIERDHRGCATQGGYSDRRVIDETTGETVAREEV